MLIVDAQLADRMVQIEIDNLVARIASYPGVVIRRFDDAVAFVSPRAKVRFFNSVQGTSLGTLAHLDAIEALYATHGLQPTFEVVPSRLTEELGFELARRGYAMVEFHAGLACEPQLGVSSTLAVDEVTFDERIADLYLECWEESEPELMKAGMVAWRANAYFRFFVAYVEGREAGVAILDLRGSTALLGSAGTLPRYRGRGVQAALIARRISEAARVGCDLLVGGAYFGTSSMRNQMRAGLSLAFTRGIWAVPPDVHAARNTRSVYA